MMDTAEKILFVMGMPLKIGVMGSASGGFSKEHLAKAERIGTRIAEKGCILITGGCPGLPLAAAQGAKKKNGMVIGISPGLSLDEHVKKYGSPTEHHDVLVFTGSGLMGREVVNIRTSDIIIMIGGRTGTLGELAIAYDEGKLIGVLTETGGISDLAADILAACQKETGARVVYLKEPEALVDEVIRIYKEEHYRKPSIFCGENVCGGAEFQKGREYDVVCGMWIDPQQAFTERHVRNKKYFFCSACCAEKFDKEPSKYESKSKRGEP